MRRFRLFALAILCCGLLLAATADASLISSIENTIKTWFNSAGKFVGFTISKTSGTPPVSKLDECRVSKGASGTGLRISCDGATYSIMGSALCATDTNGNSTCHEQISTDHNLDTIPTANFVRLLGNDATLATAPTCLNYGALNSFTIIDKDPGTADNFVFCQGVTEVENFPSNETPTPTSTRTPTPTTTPTLTGALTATPTATLSATPTATTAATPVAAVDWSASFRAWNEHEDSTGVTRINNTSTGCTTNCDLTSAGSITKDTTSGEFIQKTASSTLSNATSRLKTADATANNSSNYGCAGPVTFGAWTRPTTVAQINLYSKTNLSTNGWLALMLADGSLRCFCGDGNGLNNTDVAAIFTANVGTTWACRCGTGTPGAIQTFAGGAPVGATAPRNTMVAATNDTFLGGTGPYLDGQMDDNWFTCKALTDAQVARRDSCSIDGSLCKCSGANQANYSTCSANADCGGAGICSGVGGTCRGRDTAGALTLTACNASAP